MSAGNGLIDKSYKILFVIYAPIAVGTFIVKFFSFLAINTLFLTAVAFSGVSIILAVAIIIAYLFNRQSIQLDEEINIPFLLKHKFLIFYIFITLVSFGVSLYHLYQEDKYGGIVGVQSENDVTEIVVLVHITNELDKQWEETEKLVEGLGLLVMKKPEVTRRFHFSFIDHKNKFDESLEEIVKVEIDKGVKYFLCISSEACLSLSQKFETITETNGFVERKPLLIMTGTASSEIQPKIDGLYRFYPRNQDQASLLVKLAGARKLKKVSYIAVDNAYGRDAVAQFISQWTGEGREIVPGLFLDPLLSRKNAKMKIEQYFSTLTGVDAIFVAHTENITEGLLPLAQDKVILASAGYHADYYTKYLGKAIPYQNWITIEPDYKADDASFNLISTSFFYLTLDKLTDSILESEGDPKQFHRVWTSEDYPPVLNFVREGEADFKIQMRERVYR